MPKRKPVIASGAKQSHRIAVTPAKFLLKDGLPLQAFAIMDNTDPEQWQLPHHSKQIIRAIAGHKGIEQTVDWLLLEKAVLLLSRYGDEGRRVTADPALIINAARHLAGHYRKCGRQIPVTLCALITEEI